MPPTIVRVVKLFGIQNPVLRLFLVSGLSRWRCQVMTMLVAIIVVALLILELGF